jgi:hypothetical protein
MVKSVRVDDISELSLVPSISVYFMIQLFCVCWCYVLRRIYDVCDVTHTGQAEKLAWPRSQKYPFQNIINSN